MTAPLPPPGLPDVTDNHATLLTAVQAQPRGVLERAGILARVGDENLVPDFRRAVERSREILAAPVGAP